MEKKVGRNDPCPCGSGKKYKNCCLGKDESKKTYTSAGKRKFKARVLSLQDKMQSIFSSTPTAPTIKEAPEASPYRFLRFKQTPIDYEMEVLPAVIPFPVVTSTQKEFPMPEPADQSDISIPDSYVMTTIDYRA